MNILHELFSFLIEKNISKCIIFLFLKDAWSIKKNPPDIHVYEASTDKQDACIWKESLRIFQSISSISNFMI